MADCPPVGAPGRCLEISPRSRPARRQPCCGGRGRPLATGDRNPRPPAWRPPAVWRHRGKRLERLLPLIPPYECLVCSRFRSRQPHHHTSSNDTSPRARTPSRSGASIATATETPSPPIHFIPHQARFVPPDGVLVACGFPSLPDLATVIPCSESEPATRIAVGLSPCRCGAHASPLRFSLVSSRRSHRRRTAPGASAAKCSTRSHARRLPEQPSWYSIGASPRLPAPRAGSR